MPRTPRLPIIVSGATIKDIEAPHFVQCLANWSQFATRLIVTVPASATVPKVKGARIEWRKVDRETPTLADVLQAGMRELGGMQPGMAVIDNSSVLRFRIFRMEEMVVRHQLSLSWMATANPRLLIDYDTAIGTDESLLAFFYGMASVWQFMRERFMPDQIPFVQPIWSGWLGTWASRLPEHKYHDITTLNAVGRFETAVEHDIPASGFGPLTWNPPRKSYVKYLQPPLQPVSK